MLSRRKHHIQERLKRLFYIKWELTSRVHEALKKNTFISFKNSTASSLAQQQYFQKKNHISRHMIVCPVNSSLKIVSKKYRLSRFSLNTLARANNISGLLRRGW